MLNRSAIIPIFLPYAGCGEKCIYCNQELLTERSTTMNPTQVTQFIERTIPTINRTEYPDVEVAFYGGTFTDLPPQDQEAYLRGIHPFIETHLASRIRISTRPDTIDRSLLVFLKNYHVGYIEIGVQSFDNEVLIHSKRGYTAEEALQACDLVQRNDFHLGIHLMLGLPGDTPDKSIESARTAARLQPDLVRLHPTLVLKDTELARMYQRREFSTWSLDKMIDTLCTIVMLLEKKHISIGRIGLQMTSAMREQGAIVAGEAFRHLRDRCMSRIFRDKMINALDTQKGNVTLSVHPKELAFAIGYKKENLLFLCEKYPELRVRITVDHSLPEGSVICSREQNDEV